VEAGASRTDDTDRVGDWRPSDAELSVACGVNARLSVLCAPLANALSRQCCCSGARVLECCQCMLNGRVCKRRLVRSRCGLLESG